MTSKPILIGGDLLASEAAAIMRDADVGILPVVKDKILVGIVTDRDLVLKSLADNQNHPVIDIMTADPVTVSPDDSMEDVRRLMAEKQVRRLVVCDGSSVVGVVSVGDLATEGASAAAGQVMQETGPRD